MENIAQLIEQERKRKETASPQPIQNPENIKMSLMALKNAVDGHGTLAGNPIFENIKKVDNAVKVKKGEITPNTMVDTQPNGNYGEKEDQFTKDLLMKTRQYISGGGYTQQQTPIHENTIKEVQSHPTTQTYSPIEKIAKDEVYKALQDTIMELYVKERVESILKEFMLSDEGKKMIKEIVVGLFKKK